MINLLIKILEIFTLDYIPRLPVQFRTKLYKTVLPLRKLRDRILLNKPKSQFTFQDRIDFARTSRVGYDYSGSRLIEYNQNVDFEKIENSELEIYKFTPKNAKDDVYGIYFHGGGYYTGSVTSHKNIVSQFTNDLEMPFYFFEYKLTPEFNFPAAHDDAKKVVNFITGIEGNKQSIWMGESAGGGLATGILVDDTFTISPDKLVLMSPWLDLSDKKRDRKYLRNKDISKVMLFSFHAIEQADFLRKEDFIKLLGLPIKFKAIHFEPVAWQYKEQGFPFGNHYNQNFKDILDSLERDGILKVNSINYTYYNCNTGTGGKNSTLIEWEKL